jgi:hypothetical protein
MTVSDKEIITFLNQMPPEMKQDAIKGMEFLRRMTIADYKAKQIEAAEALITDIQNNPDNYSTVVLNNKFAELLGDFAISDDLEKRIMIIKHFIGYRNTTVYNTDGSVEQHDNASYGEYLQSKNYTDYLAFISGKPKKGNK